MSYYRNDPRSGSRNRQRSRNEDDHSIYRRHYGEPDRNEGGDRRRFRESGPANSPNYGRPVYEDGPDIGQRYGYNQGRNSTSNIGGRAYGQSYGQQFQGSDRGGRPDSRDYEDGFDEYSHRYRRGDYDEYYGDDEDAAYYDRNERDRAFREAGYNAGPEDWSPEYRDRREERMYDHGSYRNERPNQGFVRRAERRGDHDWREADSYRGGQAPRRRGAGRYGNR